MWWKKRLDLSGGVFFQGALAPSLDGLDGLSRAGIEVTRAPSDDRWHWAADLVHPAWGTARLSAPRARMPLSHLIVDFAPGLSPGERATLKERADRGLVLDVPARDGDVLRDRKRFLRFLAATLDDDGIAGIDALAQTVWTPARLADELAHDAPLDILQVHVLHVVTEDAGVWLHSHGLGELGLVDFDVLRPAEELTGAQFDVLRAIASAVAEGAKGGDSIEPILYAEPIALVDAATFMTSAAAGDRALRDPEGHTEKRVVCCDPNPPGWFGRMLGRGSVRPSRLLERGMEAGKHLVHFSLEATELSALRARECLGLLGSLASEFEDLECKPLAKIGYGTDSGGEGAREHLWFEVHGVGADGIDGTLLNEPFDIAGMKAGQRAKHDVAKLSDWALLTPLGQITPRSLEVARKLRELRPEIEEALREARKEG